MRRRLEDRILIWSLTLLFIFGVLYNIIIEGGLAVLILLNLLVLLKIMSVLGIDLLKNRGVIKL